MVNIARVLERSCQAYGDRIAIAFEDERISYAELERRASAVAWWLTDLGITRGDRIAIDLPNIPAFAEVYYGAMKVGAVAVSISAAFKSEEIEYILRDSGSRILFTTEALYEEAGRAAARCPELEYTVSAEGSAPRTIAIEEIRNRRPRRGSATFPAVVRMIGAPAAILYTSGTTGKSKGAVLTHGNVVSNMSASAHYSTMGSSDVIPLFLPLFHCFGQNFVMNGAISAGSTIVLMRRFEREACLAAVREHRATMFFAVPTIYIGLLNSGVLRDDLASIRYYFSAAATMPEEVATRWWERFGTPIHEGYGLTETSPFAAYNHVREYRPGSIGEAIEGVEMRVVDETDHQVDQGTWGEIVIRGPNVMKGYFGREAETAQALRGGWFHSGDIGYVDEDGYFHLVDRVKDMINAAGFKVWPREVEEIIYRVPGVKEAAVVGVEDPVKGEVVKAFVVKDAGSSVSASEISDYCRAHIAGYKVPKDVEIVAEIPKSPTGKILKRILRTK
jgi:long-chain acyl-CoA synthetase